MPLSLIGLGLGDELDITVRGLQLVKSADTVYLEAYTAILISSSLEQLCAYYGRSVVLADREFIEAGEFLDDCAVKEVAVLVVGDPFGATTHSDLVVRCAERKIPVRVVHNASILNAVGACGLQLYRFGQVLSLCFWTETWRPDSFYTKLLENRRSGLHTLLLLDIKVKEISNENLARGRNIYEPPRFMTVNQAVEQLLAVEARHKGGAVDKDAIAIGVARIGSGSQQIVAAPLEQLATIDFGAPLHSLVIPGDVHDCELPHVALFFTQGLSLETLKLSQRPTGTYVPPPAADAVSSSSDDEREQA